MSATKKVAIKILFVLSCSLLVGITCAEENGEWSIIQEPQVEIIDTKIVPLLYPLYSPEGDLNFITNYPYHYPTLGLSAYAYSSENILKWNENCVYNITIPGDYGILTNSISNQLIPIDQGTSQFFFSPSIGSGGSLGRYNNISAGAFFNSPEVTHLIPVYFMIPYNSDFGGDYWVDYAITQQGEYINGFSRNSQTNRALFYSFRYDDPSLTGDGNPKYIQYIHEFPPEIRTREMRYIYKLTDSVLMYYYYKGSEIYALAFYNMDTDAFTEFPGYFSELNNPIWLSQQGDYWYILYQRGDGFYSRYFMKRIDINSLNDLSTLGYPEDVWEKQFSNKYSPKNYPMQTSYLFQNDSMNIIVQYQNFNDDTFDRELDSVSLINLWTGEEEKWNFGIKQNISDLFWLRKSIYPNPEVVTFGSFIIDLPNKQIIQINSSELIEVLKNSSRVYDSVHYQFTVLQEDQHTTHLIGTGLDPSGLHYYLWPMTLNLNSSIKWYNFAIRSVEIHKGSFPDSVNATIEVYSDTSAKNISLGIFSMNQAGDSPMKEHEVLINSIESGETIVLESNNIKNNNNILLFQINPDQKYAETNYADNIKKIDLSDYDKQLWREVSIDGMDYRIFVQNSENLISPETLAIDIARNIDTKIIIQEHQLEGYRSISNPTIIAKVIKQCINDDFENKYQSDRPQYIQPDETFLIDIIVDSGLTTSINIVNGVDYNSYINLFEGMSEEEKIETVSNNILMAFYRHSDQKYLDSENQASAIYAVIDIFCSRIEKTFEDQITDEPIDELRREQLTTILTTTYPVHIGISAYKEAKFYGLSEEKVTLDISIDHNKREHLAILYSLHLWYDILDRYEETDDRLFLQRAIQRAITKEENVLNELKILDPHDNLVVSLNALIKFSTKTGIGKALSWGIKEKLPGIIGETAASPVASGFNYYKAIIKATKLITNVDEVKRHSEISISSANYATHELDEASFYSAYTNDYLETASLSSAKSFLQGHAVDQYGSAVGVGVYGRIADGKPFFDRAQELYDTGESDLQLDTTLVYATLIDKTGIGIDGCLKAKIPIKDVKVKTQKNTDDGYFKAGNWFSSRQFTINKYPVHDPADELIFIRSINDGYKIQSFYSIKDSLPGGDLGWFLQTDSFYDFPFDSQIQTGTDNWMFSDTEGHNINVMRNNVYNAPKVFLDDGSIDRLEFEYSTKIDKYSFLRRNVEFDLIDQVSLPASTQGYEIDSVPAETVPLAGTSEMANFTILENPYSLNNQTGPDSVLLQLMFNEGIPQGIFTITVLSDSSLGNYFFGPGVLSNDNVTFHAPSTGNYTLIYNYYDENGTLLESNQSQIFLFDSEIDPEITPISLNARDMDLNNITDALELSAVLEDPSGTWEIDSIIYDENYQIISSNKSETIPTSDDSIYKIIKNYPGDSKYFISALIIHNNYITGEILLRPYTLGQEVRTYIRGVNPGIDTNDLRIDVDLDLKYEGNYSVQGVIGYNEGNNYLQNITYLHGLSGLNTATLSFPGSILANSTMNLSIILKSDEGILDIEEIELPPMEFLEKIQIINISDGEISEGMMGFTRVNISVELVSMIAENVTFISSLYPRYNSDNRVVVIDTYNLTQGINLINITLDKNEAWLLTNGSRVILEDVIGLDNANNTVLYANTNYSTSIEDSDNFEKIIFKPDLSIYCQNFTANPDQFKVIVMNKGTISAGGFNVTFIPDSGSESIIYPVSVSNPSINTTFLTVLKENGTLSVDPDNIIDEIDETNNIIFVNVTSDYQVLQANFTSNRTLGLVPLTVQFTDNSTGNITSRIWSFGDSTIAENVTEVTHTYTQSGNYTVTLTVSSPYGEDSTSQVIQVLPPQFTLFGNATIYGDPAPQDLQVTATVTGINQSVTIDTPGWYGESEIGKGLVISGDIPTGTPITFTIGGLPARCGIVNEAGNVWFDSYPFFPNSAIHLDLDVPATIAADFSGTPKTGYAPFEVVFTDNSTGDPFERVWDFGDGSTSHSNLRTINHTFTTPGTYSISLKTIRASASDTEKKNDYITAFLINNTITVTSPNGGEKWTKGSTQTLRWNYTGNPGSTVSIEVVKGTAFRVIAQNISIGSDGSGSFNFTFPYGTPLGSDYLVRITSTSNATCTDTSDAPFAIIPPITLLSPNGGEEWQQGSTQTIRWHYTGDPGPSVKIEALRGNTVLAVITPGTPVGSGGSGSMNLTLPINTPVGTDYRIRISSPSNTTYSDTSDAPFRVIANAGASVTLVSPAGGETYLQGSTQTLTWNYTGDPGPLVKIEALRGDTLLAVITPGTSIGSGGSGFYNLTFPYNTPLGSEYRIRITSTTNPAWNDMSDDPFTVSSAIQMVSPNGDENWIKGSTYPITWTYNGNPGPAVKIEALRGEAVLATVATSYPIGSEGSGTYNLNLPMNTPLGADYRFRITSTTYPACTDMSDSMFTISA